MSESYSVYMHTNLINDKKYIGITKLQPEQRWRKGFGYWNNKHFKAAILKYGWDNFSHEIIQEGLNLRDAVGLEKALIEKHKSNYARFGYNQSAGGEQPAYRHYYNPPQEVREKLSKARRGKKLSPETRRRISESKTGKGNGKTGMFGKDCGQAKKIYRIDPNGKISGIYFGAEEICRMFGYKSPSKIGDVCRGIRKTAYGYKWKYAEV